MTSEFPLPVSTGEREIWISFAIFEMRKKCKFPFPSFERRKRNIKKLEKILYLLLYLHLWWYFCYDFLILISALLVATCYLHLWSYFCRDQWSMIKMLRKKTFLKILNIERRKRSFLQNLENQENKVKLLSKVLKIGRRKIHEISHLKIQKEKKLSHFSSRISQDRDPRQGMGLFCLKVCLRT